mgnify:CR=1 FL=1
MNLKGNERYMNIANSFLVEGANFKLFKNNSIIFPKNGGAVFTNKKRILTVDSLVDLNTGVFSPSKEIYFDFAFLLFSTIDFRKIFKGTALPTVDSKMLNNLMFAIPPLEEQKRIVTKVEELLAIVDSMKK